MHYLFTIIVSYHITSHHITSHQPTNQPINKRKEMERKEKRNIHLKKDFINEERESVSQSLYNLPLHTIIQIRKTSWHYNTIHSI